MLSLRPLVCFTLLLAGCSQVREWPDRPGKKVLASFPPIYCISQQIAGDDAVVLCLLTDRGPHDYQAGQADALKARGADAIFFNGLELDDGIIERIASSTGKKVKTFPIAEAIPHEYLDHPAHEEPDPKEKGHHHHHHGEHDPHVWLSPKLAAYLVDEIAKNLAILDPSKKGAFEERAKKLKSDLADLHDHGKKKLAGKKNRKLVASHDSLGYFAKAFDLEIVGSIRLQSGLETPPAALEALAKTCKEKGVAAIAYEPQYPKNDAENLQRALKTRGVEAVLVELDPLETAPVGADRNPDPRHYLDRLKKNIDNLAAALP